MARCKHGMDDRFCAVCNRVARPVPQKRSLARQQSSSAQRDEPLGLRASDVVVAGEHAVALFTRGEHFTLKPDGTAVSGNWKMNAARHIDKVIIYRQDARGGQHEIFVGVPVEISEADDDGRRKIRMTDVRCVGTTGCNWNQFTDTKPGSINPIIYVGE